MILTSRFMAKFHIGNRRCKRQVLHVVVGPTEIWPEATVSLQPSNHSRAIDPSVEKKQRHGGFSGLWMLYRNRGAVSLTLRGDNQSHRTQLCYWPSVSRFLDLDIDLLIGSMTTPITVSVFRWLVLEGCILVSSVTSAICEYRQGPARCLFLGIPASN